MTALTVKCIRLNGSLSKVTKKKQNLSLVGLYVGETCRFVQMKCLVQQLCLRTKWLGFEMKSVMYFSHTLLTILLRGEGSVTLTVESPIRSVVC